MIDYETLRIIWWLLLGVLLAGFAIMDGFDLGIAALVWFMTRPVTAESEPQVAAPTQEGLSAPAPPDPTETAAAIEPTVEPAVEPSAEPSAAPSASAEPPKPKAPAVKQQKPATKSTTKAPATGTSDADNMLKYRK